MSSFNPLLTVKFDEDPMGKYNEMKIAMETLTGTLCCELYDTDICPCRTRNSLVRYGISTPIWR